MGHLYGKFEWDICVGNLYGSKIFVLGKSKRG